jgi:hypothetical protein
MSIRACIRRGCWIFILLVCTPTVQAETLSEYRLKTAFLYNFAIFTEWPADVGSTLNFCVYGQDPFGEDLDKLQNKKINERSIAIQRTGSVDGLKNCQLVFVARSAIGDLPRVLDTLSGQAALTVADSPGAAGQGVALNMDVVQNKIVFEANLGAARKARLKLSSKLLNLAREVWQ